MARPYSWPDNPPEGLSFERSSFIKGIRFTGRWANYTGADTWYLSWAADGHNYSPYTDGYLWSKQDTPEVDCPFCNPARQRLDASGRIGGRRLYHCHSNVPPTSIGQARIEGDDPLNLEVVNLGKMFSGQDLYPSVGVIAKGVWYIGSYEAFKPQGRFNGFRWSRSWNHWEEKLEHPWTSPYWKDTRTPQTDFWPQDQHPRRFNNLHAVVFGQENKLSPDGKIYFTGHGAQRFGYSDWDKGDIITLCRVEAAPDKVSDPAAYEFFAGRGKDGTPLWSKNVRSAAPLISAPKMLGSESMTFVPGLNRYILMSARLQENEKNLPYNLLTFWESEKVTGPFRLVHALRNWGPQTYFPHIPAKFISPNGRRMWFVASANYSTSDKADPFGARYALSLHEIELDLGDAMPEAADALPAPRPDRVLADGSLVQVGELPAAGSYRLEWNKPIIAGAIRLWDDPSLENWVREAEISLSDGSTHKLRAWLSTRGLAPGEVKLGGRKIAWAEVRITENSGKPRLAQIEVLKPQGP